MPLPMGPTDCPHLAVSTLPHAGRPYKKLPRPVARRPVSLRPGGGEGKGRGAHHCWRRGAERRIQPRTGRVDGGHCCRRGGAEGRGAAAIATPRLADGQAHIRRRRGLRSPCSWSRTRRGRRILPPLPQCGRSVRTFGHARTAAAPCANGASLAQMRELNAPTGPAQRPRRMLARCAALALPSQAHGARRGAGRGGSRAPAATYLQIAGPVGRGVASAKKGQAPPPRGRSRRAPRVKDRQARQGAGPLAHPSLPPRGGPHRRARIAAG